MCVSFADSAVAVLCGRQMAQQKHVSRVSSIMNTSSTVRFMVVHVLQLACTSVADRNASAEQLQVMYGACIVSGPVAGNASSFQ